MRKIILTEYVSLDGIMEEPSWTAPYWNAEIARFKFDELFSCDALLLGRITYQGFAAAWPNQKDEQGFADRMNSMPKYVVSTTLTELSWTHSRLIQGEVIAKVTELKQQSGQSILIYGSGALATSLMQPNLIDEYHLLVYPLVLGKGKRIFEYGKQTNLSLTDVRTFSSGVVALTYQAVAEAR